MTRQFPLPLPHREVMEADDFMVTSSNREAVAWIDQWPNWQTSCSIIQGPSGSGKTHLMNMWMARSHGKAISASELAAKDIGTLVTDHTVFALDNADQVAGNALQEEALFHLYNRLKEANGSLLLTAKQAPNQWGLKLPDLKSRLTSVPHVVLGTPDDDLLSALLIKQFRDRQIDIGMDVVNYLLPRITRTPAALRDLVTNLDRASLAEGRGITVALARHFIEDQSFPIS